MTNIDTSFLFAAVPPAFQDMNQRLLAATEQACYRGPHLKLSCGLLCLDLDDGEPAVAEIIGKGPGEALMVRIRTLGTTGWLTRTRGEALLDEDGSLTWTGSHSEASPMCSRTDEACPRCVGSETAGKGIADWQYAVSPPSVWDPDLGRLMRTGLCIYCDAAVYRGHDGQLWHAAADRYFRLPA